MRLVEIMRIANKGYEASDTTRWPGQAAIITLRGFFDPKTGVPLEDEVGDGLAKFIVREIYETYEQKASDTDQLAAVERVLVRAREEIDSTINSIVVALDEASRNPLDRLAEIGGKRRRATKTRKE